MANSGVATPQQEFGPTSHMSCSASSSASSGPRDCRRRRARAPPRSGLLLLCAGCGPAASGVEIGGTVGYVIPTENPSDAWPAATALDSNNSWPSGYQPTRFEYWPQTGFGTSDFVLHPCWRTTVVEDTTNGWQGHCKNLIKAKNKRTLLSCRDLCFNEPRCAVWQFNNVSGDLQCWVGFGTDCNRQLPGTSVQVLSAQRIQHGEVRVVRNFTGLRIQKLWHLGKDEDAPEGQNIARCRTWCHAALACQYWQYGSEGCWVDSPFFSTHRGKEPTQVVQYPLTSSGFTMDPEMVAGEYLEHYCPPRQTTSMSPALGVVDDVGQAAAAETGEKRWGSKDLLWMFLLVGIPLLACAGFLVWCLANHRLSGSKKKKKHTRALVRRSDLEQDSYSDVEDQQPLMDTTGRFSGSGRDSSSSRVSFRKDSMTAGLNPGPPLRAELTSAPLLPPPQQRPLWVPRLMSFRSPSWVSFMEVPVVNPQASGRLPAQILQPPVFAGQGVAGPQFVCNSPMRGSFVVA